MTELRSLRTALCISQSRLARLSGVSRFKICTYELGDTFLSKEEQERIRQALHAEAERVRKLAIQIEFSRSDIMSVKEVSQ